MQLISKTLGALVALSLVASLTGCPFGDPVTCEQENEQTVELVSTTGAVSGDLEVTLTNGDRVDLTMPGSAVDAGDAGTGACSAASFVSGESSSVSTTFEISCALPDGTKASFTFVVPDTRSLDLAGTASASVDPGQTATSGETCIRGDGTVSLTVTQATGGPSGYAVTSDYAKTIAITGTVDVTGPSYEKPAGPIDLDDAAAQPTACVAPPAFSAVDMHLVLEQHASDFMATQGCQ